LGYVGNYSDFNQYQGDINAVPVGRIPYATALASANGTSYNWDDGADDSGKSWRPMKNYKGITTSIIAGKTQYDGLQVSLHRSVGWVNLMANYTWSKTYGNGLVKNGGTYSGFPDMGRSEYWGVSTEDRPHTFNVSYTLNLPKIKASNRVVRGVANGWQISGVTQISSGANLTSNNNGGYSFGYSWDNLTHKEIDPATKQEKTVTDVLRDNVGLTRSDAVTIMPTIVCNPVIKGGQKVTLADGSVGMRYLNPSCLAPTASGLGSTHMPYLGGPAYYNSDLSLSKNFKVTERQNLQFKFQAFNFINHALWSFGNKDNNLLLKYKADGTLDNNFGVATQRYGHRTMQFEARYSF
jgi:hypothetical protein